MVKITYCRPRRRRRVGWLAVLIATAFSLVLGATPALAASVEGEAVADPGDVSHVDALTAAVDAGGVAVTGRATFVDVPGIVGEDPTDDPADAVGAVAPLGTDLATATISRPDPFGDTVRFTLDIANYPPVDPPVPANQLARYQWLSSLTIGGMPFGLVLRAYPISTANPPGRAGPELIEPYFTLLLQGTGENKSGSGVRDTTGFMGDGVVSWDVPVGPDVRLGQIPAGHVLTTDRAITNLAVLGVTLAHDATVYDTMGGLHPYTVPDPSVRMGIAPAGTPAEDIPLTTAGTVDATGAFQGRLPTPTTPGEYTVAVQACYGPDSCGIATTTVTV